MPMRVSFWPAAGAAAIGLSACASYGPAHGPPGYYGDYAYMGEAYRHRGADRGRFFGPGARIIDPWLADTEEGWYIVTRGFRGAHEGYLTEDVAHRANIWFRRYADADNDMRLTDAEIRRALAWVVTGPTIADLG